MQSEGDFKWPRRAVVSGTNHSLFDPAPAVMSRRTNSATSRLRQDYMRLKKDPVPYIVAEPLPSNILEWHYVVEGPESR